LGSLISCWCREINDRTVTIPLLHSAGSRFHLPFFNLDQLQQRMLVLQHVNESDKLPVLSVSLDWPTRELPGSQRLTSLLHRLATNQQPLITSEGSKREMESEAETKGASRSNLGTVGLHLVTVIYNWLLLYSRDFVFFQRYSIGDGRPPILRCAGCSI